MYGKSKKRLFLFQAVANIRLVFQRAIQFPGEEVAKKNLTKQRGNILHNISEGRVVYTYLENKPPPGRKKTTRQQ